MALTLDVAQRSLWGVRPSTAGLLNCGAICRGGRIACDPPSLDNLLTVGHSSEGRQADSVTISVKSCEASTLTF